MVCVLAVENEQLKHEVATLEGFDQADAFEVEAGEVSRWSHSEAVLVLDEVFLQHYPQTLERPISLPTVLVASAPPSETTLSAAQQKGWQVFYRNPESQAQTRQNLKVFLTSVAREGLAVRRLNHYISDSFHDIIDSVLLKQQKEQIEHLNCELERVSKIDFLTNLLNRKALLEAFENEKRRTDRNLWRLERSGNSFLSPPNGDLTCHVGNFSCLIVDIDHFKHVNDTYGHLIGDEVLRKFGALVREKGLFRETDVIGRFGGEEFVILLPETNADNAKVPAERLRQTMQDTVFHSDTGQPFHVTLSIGVAQFLPEEGTSDALIHRADQALYQAKAAGRNRVVVFS